jgi:flagellar export protein FliJ
MKSLKTLIKLRKDEVDKRRKELAEIEMRQAKLQHEHDNLGKRIDEEVIAAREFPDQAITFAAYLKRTKLRMEDLLRNIIMLQQVIDKKRDELQAAFGEQKKLEIVLDRKIEEEKFSANKREQLKMDEIAARKFTSPTAN